MQADAGLFERENDLMLKPFVQCQWRYLLAGAACYLLWPLAKAPAWQLETIWLDAAAQQQQLTPLLQFYQQHGETGLDALNAQLELDKLHAYELQLIAANAEFSDQQRDEKWAEATEFMIAHLARNVTDNQLRIYRSECRNNLCQIVIAAPQGLTKELQALILKYAGTLKAGDLEFQQLEAGSDRVMLQLHSSKRLMYKAAEEKRLAPPEKATWLAQVKLWLEQQK